MDLMNDDTTLSRSTRSAPQGCIRSTWRLPHERRCRSSSAPHAEFALPMAIEIAVGPDGDGADGVVVVDAADDHYLQVDVDARRRCRRLGHLRAVVVHDVDALDLAQQSALMALVAHAARPRACRIIATTSVPLFERVLQGSFDSGLFYASEHDPHQGRRSGHGRLRVTVEAVPLARGA